MTPQESANQAMAASMHANNLTQILPLPRPNQTILGRSGGHELDVPLSAQLLANSVGHCVNVENGIQRRHLQTYHGRPLVMKDVVDGLGSGMFLNSLTRPQCLDCFESPSQQTAVLNHGNLMPTGTRVQPCPASYPCLQQSLTSNIGSLDAYDMGGNFGRGCFGPDEKLSSSDKSSGSSCRSVAGRSRWRPNDRQLEILQRFIESGNGKATPELHASVQGCGSATECNVNIWIKNRAARGKKPNVKTHAEGLRLQDLSSIDSTQMEDFKTASQTVMAELTNAISGVRRSDALYLARAIQGAKHICCYGAGTGALVMKGLAAGLHHLGYESFFIDDSNVPHFDNKSLVLISAGPGSGHRVFGMIDDMRSVGSHVVIFAPYKSDDSQHPFLHTILIPCRAQSALQGSDSEVMSSMPDPPQDSLVPGTLFDLSLTLLCECVCVMLRKANKISPAEIRARHTNLE